MGKRKGPSLDHAHWPKKEVSEMCQQCTLCNLMVYKPLMSCRGPLVELPQHNPSGADWSPEKKERLNIPGEYTGLASVRRVWQSVSVRGSDKVTKTDVVQLVLSRSGVAEGTRDTDFQG